ncbi:dihydroorotate dehydrogenase electron transfer subunit [Proteiniclasticum sp. BAD-10]|uniref:Dihydroorotate dehydrogenase B (NAD(+)), electron transfer subunit n=1 Tax=Proteiniclasticum sediminis TaxID=2804028 RepID=A0A941HQ30_9CLOT|nr:dihydroorotate dehydrogenase electron transfer subunit [Proteiniclasticum sediminis]MBR0575023.1 dihydroorotate dehydrogenase electron transfer subunit [Proteiniclasticum sediminis]
MKKIHELKVLENKSIAEDTFKLTLDGSSLGEDFPAPGTFFQLKIDKGGAPLLRRPISVFDADEVKQTLTLIYKVLGWGTKLMTGLVPGDLLNVHGPLGTGFPIQGEAGKVLLVGGGIGVPPLYELGKRLQAQGAEIVTVLGFRGAGQAFALEEFSTLGPVYVATEDGTLGTQGFVTDAIREHEVAFDTLYACGPQVMLKALDQAYQETKNGYLSFEERMACGIGACYGCMTETKEGLKRVCKDGPVFAMGEVQYGD